MPNNKRRKKYFANRVQEWQNIPSEMLEDIDFEEFMDWRVGSWELSPQYSYLIREYIYNDDGQVIKVKSHDYQKAHAAKKLLERQIPKGNREFVIADEVAIHLLPTNETNTQLEIDE